MKIYCVYFIRFDCLYFLNSITMVRETGVQSQVESYQRHLKWYLIPPCLTLSNIKYVSRVKWSNSGKVVAPFLTPRCSSYRKGSLLVTFDYIRQLYFYNGIHNVIPSLILFLINLFQLNLFLNSLFNCIFSIGFLSHLYFNYF